MKSEYVFQLIDGVMGNWQEFSFLDIHEVMALLNPLVTSLI